MSGSASRPSTHSDIMPSKSEALTKSGYYALDDNNLNFEVARLKTQYLHFKTVFGSNTVPPVVNINLVTKVIDVATGTGAWALDFVSQPNVRDRDVQVFACDISSAKFPQENNPDVDKISFFEHDVTKPFPDQMLRTFDLVNMSCMCLALTAQGWKSALQNLRDLLKPGGHLTLREIDLVLFTHENPPPLDGQEPDIAAYTQGKSAFSTINRLFSGWAFQQGFDIGLSYHLRKMFQDASLQVLSSTRVLAPYGEYCLSHKGLNGTSLSEFTTFTSQNLSHVLDSVTLAMMKAGYLELGDGTRISDEEERKALMRESEHIRQLTKVCPLGAQQHHRLRGLVVQIFPPSKGTIHSHYGPHERRVCAYKADEAAQYLSLQTVQHRPPTLICKYIFKTPCAPLRSVLTSISPVPRIIDTPLSLCPPAHPFFSQDMSRAEPREGRKGRCGAAHVTPVVVGLKMVEERIGAALLGTGTGGYTPLPTSTPAVLRGLAAAEAVPA
ncbi:hypothetical protein EDB87DRAFT_1688405 [Lactarius vividus]|nr:hypothetical protein EDB87DRAFT_1688405 [Lactarius vividus]